jgi:transcriptional regulator with XRE-family HTH domain
MKNSEFRVAEIRKRIKEIRLKKGFSQENMGFMLGISQNSYHKIENGYCKLSLSKFFQIAKALEVKVEELIDELDPEYLYPKYNKNNAIVNL